MPAARSEITGWPEDSEAICAEIAAEDRRLAEGMWPTVVDTWPAQAGGRCLQQKPEDTRKGDDS